MADPRLRRRRHERVPIAGEVRLLIDSSSGLLTVGGRIVDISEGGCALQLYTRLDDGATGRVEVMIGATTVWLPIVIRWTRSDSRSWFVGAEFDRPTPEKRIVIRRLIQAAVGGGRQRSDVV